MDSDEEVYEQAALLVKNCSLLVRYNPELDQKMLLSDQLLVKSYKA